MTWLAIRLQAESETADALSDALLDAGALSVSCDDADAGTQAEAAQFGEPGLEPPRAWQRNVLTALIAVDGNPEEIVAAAARACGVEPPAFRVTTVEDEDWVRSTQSQFDPIRITEKLWIVPSWRTPPDPGAISISIDPGLAFGTGSHPTTRLMLRWLANTLAPGDSVLDYGCGSGILAVVAARLGARRVTGVDIDAQALVAAEENAAKNNVAVQFFAPDSMPPQPSDIVVANILANPLVVLAPLISANCIRRVALSGILEAQYGEVARAYAPHFALEMSDREDGWILMTGERR